MPRPTLHADKTVEETKEKLSPALAKKIADRIRKEYNLENNVQIAFRLGELSSLRKQKHIGPPSKYNPETHPHMVHQLALLGATEVMIAAAFQVSLVTLKTWKDTHIEFKNAIVAGKELADAKVAACLYERATGYNFSEEQLFYDRDLGLVVRAETIKHIPPDVTAQKHWLGTRQRELWAYKEEPSGNTTNNNTVNMLAPVINILPVKVIAKD
jgi:hypothetical protein